MFKDKYIEVGDVDFLYDSVINTHTYVSIDPASLSSYNLFVRPQYLESGKLQDGYQNLTDVH